MASELDKEHVRELIDGFYKAGRSGGWNRRVNEEVAEIFGKMLEETKKCTKALNWVPRPPGGKASISWFVKNFSRVAASKLRDELSHTCAQFVIRNWNSSLIWASMQ